MIKAAFCDDDLSVLNELHVLMDNYRVERNQEITYTAFHSPLELIAQIEKGMRFDILFLECAQEQRRSLILRCKSGITQISLDRLMYCEVQGRTLVFHMQNDEQLESVGSMDDLSRQLAKYNNFLRAHRSYLVNMEYIKTISSKAILMVNQDEIPVPHGKCSEIKNQYLEYAFSKDQVVLA